MFRIDDATAVLALPTFEPAGPTPQGYFGTSTIVRRDWLNHLQEELAYVIETEGLTLSKADTTLLNQALDTKVENAIQAVLETTTVALFVQPAAPTGWVQDNSYNDRVIRVVDDTGNGGSAGGSWTLSGVTVDGHALSINEIPSHNHGGGDHTHNIRNEYSTGSSGNTFDLFSSNNAYGGGYIQNSGTIIQAQGGGLQHSHGLTSDSNWRPAYVDVIACARS